MHAANEVNHVNYGQSGEARQGHRERETTSTTAAPVSASRGYRATGFLDRSAIFLSALCLVHCLAFPVLIAFLPALASVLPQQWWVHPLILAMAVPLACLALWRGWRQHGDLRPPTIGVAGLTLMSLGVAVGTEWMETLLTVLGGSAVSAAHVLNWRLGAHAGHSDNAVASPSDVDPNA